MANAISHQVSFGGNIVNAVPGVSIYSLDPYNPSNRTLNIFNVARLSAQKVASAFYQGRTINMGVYIQAANRAAADAVLDALLKILTGLEQPFIVPQSGLVRQYTATLGPVQVNAAGAGFMDLTFSFLCSDSYGYDTTYSIIANQTGLTSGNVTTQYTQGGTADTQGPFIQAKYTALSGASNKAVTVTNPANGQACVITRTWGVNDLLQIDSRNKTVQVNGADVAFSGAIPEWGLGTQKVNITDAFTTRTFDWYAYVYNRYV